MVQRNLRSDLADSARSVALFPWVRMSHPSLRSDLADFSRHFGRAQVILSHVSTVQ